MTIDIIELWNNYSQVLWEDGNYKNVAESFVNEIHMILITTGCNIIDNRAVDEIVSNLRRRGNKNSTINRKLAIYYKLLKKAYSMGRIKKVPNYLRLRENNARIRFLSLDEERTIFDLINTVDNDHYRLCEFLVDTGARVGEALSLKWGDINKNSVTFWITKSGRSRTVPLTKRAKEALSRCPRHGNAGPFSMIQYQRFRYNWTNAKIAAGLGDDDQVVPHILRHTCASRLVQAGIDLRRVQTFLGHQTIQMTLRYAHLATSDLDQCALALENIKSQANSDPIITNIDGKLIVRAPKKRA